MTGPGATEGSSVDADLATLREALAIGWPEGDHAEPHVFTEALDALATVRAELERLRAERDKASDALQRLAMDHYFARAEAAEARVRELENEIKRRRDM